ALGIFDACQTLFITIALFITIPAAIIIYFKLLFVPPFAENYTFKLITLNGITVSFRFFSEFEFLYFDDYRLHDQKYVFLQLNKAVTLPVSALINVLFGYVSLNSSMFVALNRLKAMTHLRLKGNDATFFFISISTSCILSIPALIDASFFSTLTYQDFHIYNVSLVYPISTPSDKTFEIISTVIAIAISLATLVVNLVLVAFLSNERQIFESLENRKFTAERGLAVYSIVSYIFYRLYFINNALTRYWNNWFTASAQFLFLGLNHSVLVWCLLLFTPSVRRLVFKKKEEISVSLIRVTSIA
ncbi:hypothetical protein PMAYCL1PPCAC_08998, partial [Pristionchus mayeri]